MIQGDQEACGGPCAACIRHALRQVAGADCEGRLIALAQQGADRVGLFAVQQSVYPATGSLHNVLGTRRMGAFGCMQIGMLAGTMRMGAFSCMQIGMLASTRHRAHAGVLLHTDWHARRRNAHLADCTVPSVPSCVTMTRMRSAYADSRKAVSMPPTSAENSDVRTGKAATISPGVHLP